MSRISLARGGRQDARLPAAEARLLKQINRGLPNEWWEHYHELISKRKEERLSSEEHQELIRLTDELEQREARRLRALVKLSNLRQKSLAEVMKSLGLPEKV